MAFSFTLRPPALTVLFLAAAVGLTPITTLSADTISAPHIFYTDYILDDTPHVGIINTLVGAGAFYSAGVLGQFVKVANVEAQHFWNDHISLNHVTDPAAFYSGTGAVTDHDYHATAVAQMIAGRGPEDGEGNWNYINLGIAPLATLYSGAIATSTEEDGFFNLSIASTVSTYAHFFATEKVDVINSSWGDSNSSTSAYQAQGDWIAPAIDGLVRNNPTTTMIVSAGNSGEDGGNTVGSPAVGFNVISVGALAESTAYTGIADFSSHGPSDFYNPQTGQTIANARASVHLVAPGDNLWGAADTEDPELLPYLDSEQIGATDLYFTSLAGTSFAAPIVSGGATLLVSTSYILEANEEPGWSAAARDARVIKAVLLNSADKIPGWDNGTSIQSADATVEIAPGVTVTQTYNNVHLTTQALDYVSGAGALNLAQAFDQYLGNTGSWVLDAVDVNDDYFYNYVLTVPDQSALAVTLTWFAETFSIADIDIADLIEADLAYAALADLNLEIWSVNESNQIVALLAASRTLYDTVEHVYLEFSETTRLALRVVHAGMTFDLRAPEDQTAGETFALAWNITAIPEPSTYALLGGVVLIGLIRLRRRHR